MRTLVALAAGLTLCAACGGSLAQQQGARVRTMSELTETAKAGLAARRIFFGHQSVGDNIMEGVADLVREQPTLGLRVVGVDEIQSLDEGFIAHGHIGRNEAPATKTDEFASRLDEGLASKIDIAFHKYCYVDFGPSTDGAALFDHYRTTMARLRASFPAVTLVHVTVPLTTVQTGPMAALRGLFGRTPLGYEDNVRREQFNERLRREYAGREALFDLASIEATTALGRRQDAYFKGVGGPALLSAYTTDGGHLNEVGRRRVAEELLVLLAELSTSK